MANYRIKYDFPGSQDNKASIGFNLRPSAVQICNFSFLLENSALRTHLFISPGAGDIIKPGVTPRNPRTDQKKSRSPEWGDRNLSKGDLTKTSSLRYYER